jgi:cellulose synthase/poly-beta-1,6-N-acetylglucosamine synthase-like glycosyltransferase
VQRVPLSDDEARIRLEFGTSGLARRAPTLSARTLVARNQRRFLLAVIAVIAICMILWTRGTLQTLAAITTLLYVVAVVYRCYLYVRSTRADVLEVVSDDEARAVPDEALPFYSVLIPVYKEAKVVGHVIQNLARMEYPVSRLEVLILVEGDDEETLAAVDDIDAGPQFRMVVIPPAEPRTKPKALNFGLSLARGDVIAVYDAEDEPEILQLRRAAVALGRLPADVGCLQSKLSYSNATQNIITKWFTIEYNMWFTFFLPGLSSIHSPIPLGGTSNHFRRKTLRRLGGWDPYNVTEDADLGLRMAREGVRVRILESTTLEEANSDFVNWIKQRSRWYKGYLATFLIHLRHPRILHRDMGVKGMAHITVFVGGTPLLALLNPIFWILTLIWFIDKPEFIQQIFPAAIYYAALLAWVFGNFLMVYLTLISSRFVHAGEMIWAALLTPLYWVMMSIAALKALFQLVFTPSLWEKTVHGLSDRQHERSEAPLAAQQPLTEIDVV